MYTYTQLIIEQFYCTISVLRGPVLIVKIFFRRLVCSLQLVRFRFLSFSTIENNTPIEKSRVLLKTIAIALPSSTLWSGWVCGTRICPFPVTCLSENNNNKQTNKQQSNKNNLHNNHSLPVQHSVNRSMDRSIRRTWEYHQNCYL